MNHNQFMAAAIEIYGPYKSDALQKITYTYIRERFSESELDERFATLVKRLNPKYKTPPSPADFEELFWRGEKPRPEGLSSFNRTIFTEKLNQKFSNVPTVKSETGCGLGKPGGSEIFSI